MSILFSAENSFCDHLTVFANDEWWANDNISPLVILCPLQLLVNDELVHFPEKQLLYECRFKSVASSALGGWLQFEKQFNTDIPYFRWKSFSFRSAMKETKRSWQNFPPQLTFLQRWFCLRIPSDVDTKMISGLQAFWDCRLFHCLDKSETKNTSVSLHGLVDTREPWLRQFVRPCLRRWHRSLFFATTPDWKSHFLFFWWTWYKFKAPLHEGEVCRQFFCPIGGVGRQYQVITPQGDADWSWSWGINIKQESEITRSPKYSGANGVLLIINVFVFSLFHFFFIPCCCI